MTIGVIIWFVCAAVGVALFVGLVVLLIDWLDQASKRRALIVPCTAAIL